MIFFVACVVFALANATFAANGPTQVRNADEFRAAVAAATPGTTILLAGGVYGGGFQFANLRGEPGRPITVAALDPEQPPVFREAHVGIHLSNPAHVILRGLVFTRLAQNGLNIDDGGAAQTGPARAHHIVLENLHVSDIGGDGNHDGIKLSGLEHFTLTGSTIERWGTRGGSGIDLVGCHHGLIENNTLRHNDPAPPNCTGVQAKGGSSAISIRRNRFEHAGGRAINLGGSTGLPYFRPALTPGGEYAEARDLLVEGNTFVGGITAMAFVGVDGATVRFNTIERPTRWVFRILQENTQPGFVPSRNGRFTDNLIVVDSNRAPEINVGAGTAPETFVFARNAWYNAVAPDRSRPTLPTAEIDGIYGQAPDALRNQVGAAAFSPAP